MNEGLRQREAVTALERALGALGRGDGTALATAVDRVRENDLRGVYRDVVECLSEIAELVGNESADHLEELLCRLKELLDGTPYAPLVEDAQRHLTG